MTTPSLPIFLLTLSSLHVYDQATISFREDISEMGKGTRFFSIEAQDPQDYWINCQMDDTESGSQCELIIAW